VADTLYASKEMFKAGGGMPQTNGTQDDEILRALNGASRGIDRMTGRRFWVDDAPTPRNLSTNNRITQTQQGEQILLLNGMDIATSAGLTVATGLVGGTFTPLTGYAYYPDTAELDGWPIEGIVLPLGLWTVLPGFRVQITARWGWLTVPDDVVQATLILARRLFKRKDSPAGVLGSNDWVVNLAKADPDVVKLIERFVLHGFG
jgi:hypothetical protein